MEASEKSREELAAELEKLRAVTARLEAAEEERRRTERALRESEAKFRQLVENLNDVIYAVDCAGKVTYVSPAVESVMGYKPSELIGRDFIEFVCEEDHSRTKKNVASILVGRGHNVNEYRIRTKSGEFRCVLASSHRVYDGKEVVGLRGVLADITTRRNAEERLKESEEYYRGIVEDLPLLLCCFDPEGKITFVNETYRRYFGRKREYLIGRQFLELVPEQDRQFVTSKFGSLTPEHPMVTYDHKVFAPNGEVRWQRWTDRAFFDSRGRVTGFKSVGQDITEQRELEDRLRQSEKMQAIGHLAGGIAHDFNNHLTAIMGCADLLRMSLSEDAELRGHADMILQAARRSADMAGQLLAFARKGRFQSVVIDMNRVIGEAIGLLERSIDKRIQICKKLRANPAAVLGDPSQLQSALLNIAINARDAMPQGGRLTFATDTVTLDRESCGRVPCEIAPGRYLLVAVTDNGAGMDEETRKHIFEPFFTTKTDGKGTGMGLAAVYGTVKNHGGGVYVQSEVGRGTTFRIYLPLEERAGGMRRGDAGGGAAERSARILIVEDKDAVRKVAVEILRNLGHRPTGCKDGAEALRYYRKFWQLIDLVILDLVMPGLDGRQLLAAMREINPAVKAVFCSGYGAQDAAGDTAEAGGVPVIQKPFEIGELARVIDTALSTAYAAATEP